MRNNFRQGIISYQKDGTGAPQFLLASQTAGFIQLHVAPSPTLITFAHGDADYLAAFDVSNPTAWGPLVSGSDNYLYWDMDTLTSDVTTGITTLEPIISSVEPSAPINGQHWFDLNTNKMRIWNATALKWSERIRVFAGKVLSGNSSQIVPKIIGSQVGLNTESNPGYVIIDSQLRPLRTSDGAFLTADTPVRIRTTVGTSGVLATPPNAFIPVRAGENIPAMSLVYFSGPDTVSLATSDPAQINEKTPIGVIQEALATNEVGVLTQSGDIVYDQWDWSAHIGKAVYSNSVGQLTASRPAGLMAYRVGFVKNKNTIVFDIDAETQPQVYSASAESVIIAGSTPITTVDSINGIGERVVTISIPAATTSAPGHMTAAQATALGSLTPRVTANELAINTLQVSKANVSHTHVPADITGLQALLDGKMAADKLFDDRYSLLAHNHDGRYALTIHTHTIPDVTGLQDALNSKADRYTGLLPFSRVYQTVNQGTSVDGGTGLTLADALDAKSDEGHTHAISEIPNLVDELNNRALLNHTHTISQVSGLQTSLTTLASDIATKANIVHTHAIADVTGLQTNLNTIDTDITALETGKSNVGHTHVANDVTNLVTFLNSTILAGDGVIIDYANDTITINGVTPGGFLQLTGGTLTGNLTLDDGENGWIQVNAPIFSTAGKLQADNEGSAGYVEMSAEPESEGVTGSVNFLLGNDTLQGTIGAGSAGHLRYAATHHDVAGTLHVGSTDGVALGEGVFTPSISITPDGEVLVDGDPGQSGQVLSSGGAGNSVAWAVGGGGGGLTVRDEYEVPPTGELTGPFSGFMYVDVYDGNGVVTLTSNIPHDPVVYTPTSNGAGTVTRVTVSPTVETFTVEGVLPGEYLNIEFPLEEGQSYTFNFVPTAAPEYTAQKLSFVGGTVQDLGGQNIQVTFPNSLMGLNDVNANYVPAGNDVLKFNGTSWYSNPVFVSDLSDVNLAALSTTGDGSVLTWDDATDKWIPQQISMSLNDLTDVQFLYSPNAGDVLIFSGSQWQPKTRQQAGFAQDRRTVLPLTPSAGVVTANLGATDYFTLLLTDDVSSMVFTNPPTGGSSWAMRITQNDAEAKTITWPESFRWEGDPPTVSTELGAVDVLVGTSFDSGAVYDVTLSKGRVIPTPPPALPFMRDDFLGTADALLNGREPNITTASATWRDASAEGDSSAFFSLDGSGKAKITQVDTSTVAWIFFDLPAMTSANFEIVLQNAASAPLASGSGGTVFQVELHLGSNNGKAGIVNDLVYLNSSNTGSGGGAAAANLGAGGVPVKFNVIWGGGVLSLSMDDVVIGTMSTSGGDPDSSGYFYLEVARDNLIEYVQVSGE